MDEPLDILFVVKAFPVVSQTFIHDQIKGLLEREHNVWITPKRFTAPSEWEEVDSFQELSTRSLPGLDEPTDWNVALELTLDHLSGTYRGPGRGALLDLLDLHRTWRERRMLEERSFDVMHCHFGPGGERGAELKASGYLDAKMIVSFHGYDVGPYVNRHGRDVYEDLFEQADMVTANSQYTLERTRELGAEEPLVRHPMGISVDDFDYSYTPPGDDETTRILTVARLVEKKGIEYAVRAVAKLEESDVEYTVIGGGERRSKLRSLATSLGVDDRVHFLGSQNRETVREHLEKAHVFLLPSAIGIDGDCEGQGVVLQEAQACGLPVVTTWSGGIPQSVRPGASALMAPERDVDTLAQHLSSLISDPEQCENMGRIGRQYVEEVFDISRLNDELVRTYRTLVS